MSLSSLLYDSMFAKLSRITSMRLPAPGRRLRKHICPERLMATSLRQSGASSFSIRVGRRCERRWHTTGMFRDLAARITGTEE
jgi:hypothetical protein